MFQESEKATEHPGKAIEIFYLVSTSIFGIRPENVNTELFQLVLMVLPNRFPGITIQDIRNAYFENVITKKEFVSLTRDELLDPIAIYWIKKQNLMQQIKLIEMENEKEQNAQQKEIDFYNEARELYKESLKGGEWLGDMFQARVIARPFWDALYMDERKQIQLIATEKVKDAQILAIDNPLIIVADKNFYLAQEVISHCVKQGKTFIQG
jgi:hypothetical protein